MESFMEHEDIKRHIYSFGYPKHRIYMKEICKRINTPYDFIYQLNREWDGYDALSMTQYLHTRYSYIELKQLYLITKRCNCCTRHSYYKPNLCAIQLNAKTNPNPHYSIYSTTCVCHCRSLSRHIYYAYWYDYLQVD